MYLALNILQGSICHKTQETTNQTNQVSWTIGEHSTHKANELDIK